METLMYGGKNIEYRIGMVLYCNTGAPVLYCSKKASIVHPCHWSNISLFITLEKIRDTVTDGSVLASGAQPPASVTNFFPFRVAHTLLGTFKLLYR
jgi:hypothetical protein